MRPYPSLRGRDRPVQPADRERNLEADDQLGCHDEAVTATRPIAPVAPASAPRRGRGVRMLSRIVIIALLLGPLIAVLAVLRMANHDDRTPTDAIVVLGAAQFDGRPSPVFAARLDHAAALLRDGVSSRIVTVGGKQPNDRFTEAAAGRNYLLDKGIPARSVTAIGVGNDTVSSLSAFAELAQSKGWDTVTLVTDPAHMARSSAIASALGLDSHANATTQGPGSSLTVEYVLREAAGWVWFNVRERWSVGG